MTLSRTVARFRAVLTATGVAAALVAVPSAAHAVAPAAAPAKAPHVSASQAVGQAAPDAPGACTGAFHGDARLGPEHLPSRWKQPADPMLIGYHRTGRLSPAAFLKAFWQSPADTGGWTYPPNDGFSEVDGHLDKAAETLGAGELLDRFGSEYGSFLAPAGDPYAERSLPPQSLDTRDAAFPCNYHVYKVAKAFTVWEGGIAPWFGQPGGGEQIMLNPAFVDPGAGQRLNVSWLVANGYLVRVAQ